MPSFCNAALSLVSYCVGWYLSTPQSASPLARSGAFATAVAIAFTLYDYRRAAKASEKRAHGAIERITKQLPLTGAASLREVDRRLEANTARVTTTIARTDAAVLIIATLVWGFGDLATFLM